MNVLVINTGSSSIKLKLFSFPKKHVVLTAHVDGIGSADTVIKFAGATIRKPLKTHSVALKFLFAHLPKDLVIDRVAHRVVHGAEKYTAPTKITPSVVAKLKELIPIAPLHLPANIAGITAARSLLPKATHVAVFDTAFHATIPKVAYRYGVSESCYKKYGVRKYGFHGSSHQFITSESKKILNKRFVNIISCHLGNGSSVCAIKKNKSIETSMGFSPLSGVLMGTRSGDLDPEVLYFLNKKGLSFERIRQDLEKNSGFKGLMGTNDLRKIYEKSKQGNKKAKFAIDVFSYQVARYIGLYASLLGSVDALVFTGGIGEFAFYVRKKVCDYLPLLAIILDAQKNKTHQQKISARNSKIPVLVIQTNEELVLAKEAKKVA